jgi:hypothetical protein
LTFHHDVVNVKTIEKIILKMGHIKTKIGSMTQ